jgi:hypothetical protein
MGLQSQRDANTLGAKQSRHTREKGKSRGFYCLFRQGGLRVFIVKMSDRK